MSEVPLYGPACYAPQLSTGVLMFIGRRQRETAGGEKFERFGEPLGHTRRTVSFGVCYAINNASYCS